MSFSTKEKRREYYEKYRERAKVLGRIWRKNNPEKVKASMKRYWLKHPEKLKAIAKKRYEKWKNSPKVPIRPYRRTKGGHRIR